MSLTPQQKATLKAFIQADPVLGPEAIAQNYDLMETQLNAVASPTVEGVYFANRYFAPTYWIE